MTSDVYKKAMNILTDREIYIFAEKLCKHYNFDPEKEYPQRVDSEVLSGASRRMMYQRRAADLMRRAIYLGGTKLEILKIAKYLIVISKTIDKPLDFRLCEREMDILELNRKYSQSEFLSLDISEEDLNRIIAKDTNYYEVSIKNEDR